MPDWKPLDQTLLPALKTKPRGGKVAQRLKALAAKPDDLRSIPDTKMVEGENRLLHVIF